jgi:hypothetical protein
MTRGTATTRTRPAEEDMELVAEAARKMIRRLGPELKTETKWGHPWFVGTDLVCLVGAFTHHTGIEFWRGSMLKDPRGLLEGTGKNLRHVKVRTTPEATAPALAELVREAIRLDRREPKRTR